MLWFPYFPLHVLVHKKFINCITITLSFITQQERMSTTFVLVFCAKHVQRAGLLIFGKCILHYITGRSGLVVARLPVARVIPGSKRAADKSFCAFSRKSLRYAALGTGCTLTAVPRSTQPSTLRGTVNEYQPYG